MDARVSWLDVRLGVRMLLKHPGLSLVGGLGMAVGIAISVAFFSMMSTLVFATLPLDEGERIVALENRDAGTSDEERRSLHDFLAWRGELESVQELGAFRTTEHNLVAGAGQPEPVQVAEMTAAGFQVARVPPLLGRYLVPSDERQGAPPVVVIGHDVWRNRFAADPGVVGRDVRLDGTVHTVVGVMPEGFAFPMNHRYWIPLRTDPAAHARREGPEIFIFGRLAPGVGMEEAQAELAAVGRRTAAAFPETHAQLRPVVTWYTRSLMDVQSVSLWGLAQQQLMVMLLLVVVALNVAVLVYARTATRQGEIAVRSALGASRRRIVGQLFVEALVLSAASAAAGLTLAHFGLKVGFRLFSRMEMQQDSAPFWTDYGLRPATILFTVGLAVLAAVIVGIVPAVQATGRRLQADLGRFGTSTGMRLGKVWTALIVAQVAISVAALPAAASLGWLAMRMAATRPTYPAEEFLAAQVATSTESPAAGTGAGITELMARLEAEPSVAGATYRARLPGRGGLVRVEGVPAPPESPAGHEVRSSGVHPGYHDVLGLRLLAGRSFEAADLGAEATAVIVNQAFVRQVLGGGSALGRRLRHVDPAGAAGGADGAEAVRWYEIVGVVEDLEANPLDPDLVDPALSYPVAPGAVEEVTVVVRTRGSAPAGFAGRMREVAAAVDPSLRLGTVRSLAESGRLDQLASYGMGGVVALILLSVFLLSAAGIYALMSFTVTQRRREIGIRTALGAHPGQVLRSVFARAAWQIGLGLVVGVAGAALLEGVTGGGLMEGRGVVILPALALVMALVGLLAAVGPARRGLGIQPMEALRAEG
ncbi:MAG TPA: ABC transporter permease [Longimicrobiaceae bacterium]|nr:ABC transporter permease [Longimicrobiaceae bacterium]